MKKQEEYEAYQSIVSEYLSICAVARILKIASTTAYRRLKKFKKQDKIIELANTKYSDFSILCNNKFLYLFKIKY